MLTDQRIVIFGGSSGIGLATARLALSQGARVTVVGRSQDRLTQAARELPDARLVSADITVDADVIRVIDHQDYIDHLVFTTGARAVGRVTTIDLEAARRAFDAKFWGPLIAVRHAVPKLRNSVTLTAGAAAWTPSVGSLVTSSVNGAVATLCRALAVDLAPIRVNVVSPGLIDTPTWDSMNDEDRKQMYARTAQAVPVGRIGRAEDVAMAFVFAMTNGFVTGETVHVEGGQRLVRG